MLTSAGPAGGNFAWNPLPAVEGLGACTIIASDKTGMLTRNIPSVEKILLADGRTFARADGSTGALAALRRAAALCNEASIGADGVSLGDSVDVALLRFAGDGGEDLAAIHAVVRTAALPYEPVRKFSTVAIAERGGVRVFANGAPEIIRQMCRAIDPAAVVAATVMAGEAYRVIAIAASEGVTTTDPTAPTDLVLLGWIGLIDPVRPEAPAAIARCAGAGKRGRCQADSVSRSIIDAGSPGQADAIQPCSRSRSIAW